MRPVARRQWKADITTTTELSANTRITLLGGCARKGLIRKVGYRASDRPERHGSIVAEWVGV